jgi:iron complex transport system ATP-binding protein
LTPVSALELLGVGVERDGRALLDGIDWEVRPDQRWAVLGPNGCGKTTLLRIASLYLHPTRGTVRVLGEELGRCDVRTLRTRIGLASQALTDMLRADLMARDVVVTARYAALEPWWHEYTAADRERALALLDRLGVAALAERRFGSLSTGERQRVQLARTLMADPGLLLLDEPAAGLDLAAREDLVDRLGGLAVDPATPPTVIVTHHVEEIPAGFTHVLLLRGGRTVAAGPLDDVLTEPALSDCFGVPVQLDRDADRFTAKVRRP